MASSAAAVISRICLPPQARALPLNSSTKCQTRAGMSPVRSVRVGRYRVTTRTRYMRSSRNRPAETCARSAWWVAASTPTSTSWRRVPAASLRKGFAAFVLVMAGVALFQELSGERTGKEPTAVAVEVRP